jgi:tripartite-type tricarboxylate transporter receptor subunit TctC
VRIIVGFPPAGHRHPGALDGSWLSDRLGQQFIAENRAGASGKYRDRAVAKAPVDAGYTLLQVVTPHAINAALYTNLNFDFVGTAPVLLRAAGHVVVVHPSVPATTILSSSHGEANRARSTTGRRAMCTAKHCLQLFKMMTGESGPRPVQGRAPAVTDLIAGHVQVVFLPCRNRSTYQGRQAARPA